MSTHSIARYVGKRHARAAGCVPALVCALYSPGAGSFPAGVPATTDHPPMVVVEGHCPSLRVRSTSRQVVVSMVGSLESLPPRGFLLESLDPDSGIPRYPFQTADCL